MNFDSIYHGRRSTEPTAADREAAMRVMAWDPLSYEELAHAVEEGGDPDDRESLAMVDEIAAAIAAAREEGRQEVRAG